MEYLEAFLMGYEEHIENFDALLHILSLLPDSYKFLFTINLLKNEKYLEDGNLYKGIIPDGLICVNEDGIVLQSTLIKNGSVILLEFPSIYEI